MRAVVDTNVLISGLLWHGAPHDLLACARSGQLTMITSRALLEELALVLQRPKFAQLLLSAGVEAATLVAGIRQLAETYDPPPLPAPICRDPDDDAVLALAVAAAADVVISGDDDLLVIGSYTGVPIVPTLQGLAMLAGEEPTGSI